MIMELALAALASACDFDGNTTTREQIDSIERQTSMQTEAAVQIEKEITKRQIVDGIFGWLNAGVQSGNQNEGRR